MLVFIQGLPQVCHPDVKLTINQSYTVVIINDVMLAAGYCAIKSHFTAVMLPKHSYDLFVFNPSSGEWGFVFYCSCCCFYQAVSVNRNAPSVIMW